jgi:hypothetical protein
MIFTRDHCLTLAASGSHIGFESHKFDGGAAFVDAAGEVPGLVKLSIKNEHPFDEGKFVALLNQQQKLECLTLEDIRLNTEMYEASLLLLQVGGRRVEGTH